MLLHRAAVYVSGQKLQLFVSAYSKKKIFVADALVDIQSDELS